MICHSELDVTMKSRPAASRGAVNSRCGPAVSEPGFEHVYTHSRSRAWRGIPVPPSRLTRFLRIPAIPPC